jgi:hypothetical protein
MSEVVERLVRTCDSCGQTDDHPHHVQHAPVTFDDPITGEAVMVDRSVSQHLDCCLCDHCTVVLSVAQTKRGADLIAFLTSEQLELRARLTDAGYDVGNG